MPSVRTESQPTKVANRVAMATPIGTAIHHGQPRLLAPPCASPATPKIATM